MISNNKKHKKIEFHQINFKNVKRFSKNNSTDKIISLNVQNLPSPKKKYNNSSKKLNDIDILKIIIKIEKKNQNMIKISKKKNSSNNVNKFKANLSRQKTFQKNDEKIFENKKCLLKRKPTQNSEKISNFKCNKIKRCKTVCNNYCNKISKNQDKEQYTDCNINISNYKKIKNRKKNKIINKKENNKSNKKIKNNNEIKEKRKSSDFLYIIKKKFLCCF